MTESTLKELLSESMKSAMKAKDKDRLKTIRLALSDIKRVGKKYFIFDNMKKILVGRADKFKNYFINQSVLIKPEEKIP